MPAPRRIRQPKVNAMRTHAASCGIRATVHPNAYRRIQATLHQMLPLPCQRTLNSSEYLKQTCLSTVLFETSARKHAQCNKLSCATTPGATPRVVTFTAALESILVAMAALAAWRKVSSAPHSMAHQASWDQSTHGTRSPSVSGLRARPPWLGTASLARRQGQPSRVAVWMPEVRAFPHPLRFSGSVITLRMRLVLC